MNREWVTKIESVADSVASQLESIIKEGDISPGEKLPSERQLTELLGVSRSSLREAIKKLETNGYVEVKKRQGVFVKSIDSSLQLQPLKRLLENDNTKIVQLYEVRRDLEEGAAFAAATERKQEDLEKIHAIQMSFDLPSGDRRFSWDKDHEFHVAIVRASHNIFRIHSVLNILDFSREFIKPLMEGFAESEENMSIIVEQHQSIIDALVDKNGVLARENMRTHLNWTYLQLVTHFS